MVMWAGRFKKEIDQRTNDFNSSIRFDKVMYKQDIMSMRRCLENVELLVKRKVKRLLMV